jgi:hypothetical protein
MHFFAITSMWQLVKRCSSAQNGQQILLILHNHFFGGDKIKTIYSMYSNILTTLKALHYLGDCKNFTFNKYGTAHVEQHNHHAFLAKLRWMLSVTK